MSTSNSQVRIKTEEKEDPLIMLMEPGVAMTVKTPQMAHRMKNAYWLLMNEMTRLKIAIPTKPNV